MNRLKSRLGFSITSNLISIMAALILFRPFWEVPSDDGSISRLIEGAFGYYEPHTIYTNIIYGKALCALQSVLPYVRWHIVLQYFFVFIISVSFVYAISGSLRGRVLSVLFLAGSMYEVYVSMQFTKTSTFVGILAFVTVFFEVKGELKKKSKILLWSVAVVCASYSVLLRAESFMLATMIAGVFGICIVVPELVRSRSGALVRSYIIAFVPVFLIATGCFAINHHMYLADDWKERIEYNDIRDQLSDYHNEALVYEEHAEELERLGVTQNDAVAFLTFQFGDTDYFSSELLGNIVALDKKGWRSINTDFMKAWVKNIYDELFVPNPLILGLVMLLGVFGSCIWLKKCCVSYSVYFVVQMAVAAGILFYYQYSCRWSHRIVYSLFLAMFAMLVYLLEGIEANVERNAMPAVFLFVMIFAVANMRMTNEFEYQDYLRSSPDYDLFIAYARENKNSLFVADTFTIHNYGKYDIFSPSSFGQFDNLVYSGECWTTGYPVEQSVLGRYGYDNSFVALMDRSETVVLADNMHSNNKIVYCNEHGDNAGYELEEMSTVGGIHLYHIK